jgi:hypothetical protein
MVRARRNLLAFGVSLLGFAGAVAAQDTNGTLPLFAGSEPLELTITGAFRELSHDDADERPEHDGSVELTDDDGELRRLDVKIRIRGNSRVELCDAPPLRLDFVRGQVGGTVFAGQNVLKLARVCKRTEIYRTYLAQELEIYRLLNLLTERSFRVRSALVTYIDSDSGRSNPVTEPAFFIEDEGEVADRLGLDVIEAESVSPDALEPAHMALIALFQFMIGNADWAALRGPDGESCCHNGKLVGKTGGPLYVLPYDFDQAGLINTEYAAPPANLPLRSVTQRLYWGFCATNDELPAAIALFNKERAELSRVLDDESMRASSRRRALDYLDGFFEIINDPKRLDSTIVRKCR